jgi:hypothetical protein
VAALLAAAEQVLAGRVTYFGYPTAMLTTPVQWNHDPIADVRWPMVASSKLDHRSTAADPKWIWELNRLQHLPWLAQAWLFTGREHFAELAMEHLDSWITQNPVGRGIAWRGGFEAGVRAVSVLTAVQGVRDSPALTLPRFERIVRMLAASADRCWRNRSRFSSANNHLVGELAGLAVISMLLPELRRAAQWERDAVEALRLEASRQILPDGAGAEQAVGYQLFTAELLLVVAALIRSRGDTPPTEIVGAINRSADFLASVVGESDPPPRYGDDDEGFALRLGAEPVRTIRDHLGIVSAFTGNERAERTGHATLTGAWLQQIPPSAAERRAGSAAGVTHDNLYAPSGGLVVLRSEGRRLTMDIGPLGYLSIAAHGHADALSVTLSMDGHELIGDPGTASYYGHPEWRLVHRGTRVHPTATVDGENQSVIGGPFLWTRHARVHHHSVDLGRGIVDARHDGYTRLSSPVSHRRWLVAPPDQRSALVVDVIDGEGEHEMQTSWPLHPSLEASAESRGHLVSRNGTPVLRIASSGTARTYIAHVRGDSDTHLGWWSERLEARSPSWLLSASCRGTVPLAMATVLLPAQAQHTLEIDDLDIRLVGQQVIVGWQEGRRRRRVVIDRLIPGAVHET